MEARRTCSTVAQYENAEDDAEDVSSKSGLGSKLAYMFKRKGGALSKVNNTTTTFSTCLLNA